MNNNKGFTLIELITTIALLAVIVLISFVSVNKVIDTNKSNTCNSIANNIKVAAKEYASDLRYDSTFVDLANSYRMNVIITVNDLISNNYLSGKIINPWTNKEIPGDTIGIELDLNNNYTVNNVAITNSEVLMLCTKTVAYKPTTKVPPPAPVTATLSYDANGHGIAPENVTLNYTDAAKVANAITADGFTFTNWNTEANGSGKSYAAGKEIKMAKTIPINITLYAQWVEKTTIISYDANGHGTAPASGTLKYSKVANVADAITADGYKFIEWNTKADGTGISYKAATQLKAANVEPSNIKLYAIWESNKAYLRDIIRIKNYLNSINRIYFVKNQDIPNNALMTAILDENNSGLIKGWIVNNPNSGYDMYIGANTTIYARRLTNMFSNITSLKEVHFENFDVSEVTSMNNMFAAWASSGDRAMRIETITGMEKWDTSNVTDMASMFFGCNKLKSLNVSNFNTSKVTNMSDMFFGAQSITSLDLSKWDTSKVTNMSFMFANTNKLTNLNLLGWNTSNVKDMSYMFGVGATSLNLSSFDTSNVTNMSGMFWCSYNLSSINLSSFNTSNVTNMSAMFYMTGTDSKTKFTLDLSNFDTRNVTRTDFMFANTDKIKTIYVSKLWNLSKVTESNGMFSGANGLPNISSSYGTNFDKRYAHYNRGGALTYKAYNK